MAALANVIALLSIPVPLGASETRLHLIQLPIVLAGVLAGPFAGVVAGGVGALLTVTQVNIPFIIGGNAILGGLSGYLSRRNLRPLFAGLIALVVELPYVVATDLLYLPLPIILTIILPKLVAETIISLILIEALMRTSALKSIAASLRG